MTILSSELLFFASQFPTDDSFGGGLMSGTAVQDGASGNVFPGVSEIDAANGRVNLRKVYAAVVSNNTDVLLGAGVSVLNAAASPLIDSVLFRFGDEKTTRAQAAAALATCPWTADTTTFFSNVFSASGSSVYIGNAFGDPVVGMKIVICDLRDVSSAPLGDPLSGTLDKITQVATVLSVGALSGGIYPVTLDRPARNLSGVLGRAWAPARLADNAPRCAGRAVLTATSGASSVVVDQLEVRVVPNLSPYPLSPVGFSGAAGLLPTGGFVPIFRVGDAVIVRSGAASEVASITAINHVTNTITFAAPLANSYPSGASVRSICALGDMQSAIGVSFSQQTWTRVFADSIIGNPISANYSLGSHPIAVKNIGAETDRYAIVFSSATEFRLISEKLGSIASGTTTADFLPLNPITNQPLFTIDKDGWGAGWAIGNVLRFNTIGPRAPFWQARTISPGAPTGADGISVEIRGSF